MHGWVNSAFCRRKLGMPHGLDAKLIVSLTSYPARFATLHLTLKCLLMQTVAADHTILWIAHGDKSALTPEILGLQDEGLEIAYCDDLRSYKKIIPTLRRYPNDYVVTADDDLYYWPNWLAELLGSYKGMQQEVVCHRAHHIALGVDHLPLSYAQWEHETTRQDDSTLTFPTSGAGVLYPPHVFHKAVLNAYAFEWLCPNADDVWLYWMMRKNGAIARKIGSVRPLICWANSQSSGLVLDNVLAGGNDQKISKLIATFGWPGN
ncbi:hypothetical protein RQP54_17210 [Curvibacter sp. APW13]|uniref:hypothetical protein n=1 Tax=Curvibacter sp. APW13 TaxID=3077236 RepID=UPI0028E02672|nr:hypothetical protein [Curvibacter sp. APW13]MDT8992614.1 hypothetical protein [Curvibacter sp. APW13]